jgi:hypothetical protein
MSGARRQQQLAVDPRPFPQMQRAEHYRISLRSHIDAMFASYTALLSAAKVGIAFESLITSLLPSNAWL